MAREFNISQKTTAIEFEACNKYDFGKFRETISYKYTTKYFIKRNRYVEYRK